jgi:hypothetical protein
MASFFKRLLEPSRSNSGTAILVVVGKKDDIEHF